MRADRGWHFSYEVVKSQSPTIENACSCPAPLPFLNPIFEPLHTTKPGSTGLSLYIVQQIVAAHRGQGTTVTITVPRE